jgi:hypothetical protein
MGCANGSLKTGSEKNISHVNKQYKVQNTEGVEQTLKNMKKNKEQTKKFFKLEEDLSTLSEVKLSNVFISGQTYFDLLNSLSSNHHLESFSMGNLEIEGDSDILIALANILKKKEGLKKLELFTLHNLGDKKGKSIAMIMKECSNIETLILKEIELDEKEDAEYISLFLEKYSQNLKTFELVGIYFEKNFDLMISGLATNNSIENLILQKVGVDKKRIDSILNAISSNSSLSLLSLSNNPIGRGVAMLQEYHTNFKSLHTIELNNCSIKDKHFNKLMDILKSNPTIKLIFLNNNFITIESCEAVVQFFQVNQVLENLYILQNKLCKRDLMYKLSDHDLVKIVSEI